MSVINQMLKDLDERQSEEQLVQSSRAPIVQKNSSKKLLWIFLVVVVVLNIIGLYTWNLLKENELLKSDVNALTNAKQTENVFVKKDESENKKELQLLEQQVKLLKEQNQQLKTTAEQPIIAKSSGQNVIVPSIEGDDTQPEIETKEPVEQSIAKDNRQEIFEPPTPPVTTKEKPESSFSISRRQMTPAQLSEQKMKEAEKALTQNNTEKAETLFEDILILQPEHKQARKKLAALWFGRQAYGAAINLLRQGIALDPNDSEYRLMAARIYLTNKDSESALNALKGLSDSTNTEYQSLKANLAQQSGDYALAINAYKSLLEIKPNDAKWLLGLAIAYDSNAEYSLAIQAYSEAIASDGLSKSSRDFAKQRKQALGG